MGVDLTYVIPTHTYIVHKLKVLLHTYIRAYIHAYIHANVQNIRSSRPSYIHIYIHIFYGEYCRRTYVHTYILLRVVLLIWTGLGPPGGGPLRLPATRYDDDEDEN